LASLRMLRLFLSWLSLAIITCPVKRSCHCVCSTQATQLSMGILSEACFQSSGIPIGPELTEEQARAIYALGEQAVVFALLAQAKVIAEIKASTLPPNRASDPSCPSGQIPTYAKPTTQRRKKKPVRKKGHPGTCRKQPDHVDRTEEHRATHCPDCGWYPQTTIRALPGRSAIPQGSRRDWPGLPAGRQARCHGRRALLPGATVLLEAQRSGALWAGQQKL